MLDIFRGVVYYHGMTIANNINTRKGGVSTGLPIGTFKRGEPHPELENKFFTGYNSKGYECWETTTADVIERRRKYSEWSNKRQEANRNAKTGTPRKKVKTGLPVGTFKRGDAHPSVEDRFFVVYDKGREVWASSGNPQYQRWLNSRDSAHKRNANMYQCQLVQSKSEIRQVSLDEARYDKMYFSWAKSEFPKRTKMSKEERKAAKAKKRKRYKKNNPAKVAEAKRARKRKDKSLWSKLTPSEKKMSNEVYKLRDILNKVHGKIMYEVDHIFPVCLGGTMKPENLQLATSAFNNWKGSKVGVNSDDFFKPTA